MLKYSHAVRHGVEAFLSRRVPQVQRHLAVTEVDLGDAEVAAERRCAVRVISVVYVAFVQVGFTDPSLPDQHHYKTQEHSGGSKEVGTTYPREILDPPLD